MDENPYQSPEPSSGSEKRSTKGLKRFQFAVACGFFAFMGSFLLLGGLLELLLPTLPTPYILLPAVLVGSAVAWLMVRWALRNPCSKWVFPVAFFLGACALIFVIIAGFVW